jgi:hypothetical protein
MRDYGRREEDFHPSNFGEQKDSLQKSIGAGNSQPKKGEGCPVSAFDNVHLDSLLSCVNSQDVPSKIHTPSQPVSTIADHSEILFPDVPIPYQQPQCSSSTEDTNNFTEQVAVVETEPVLLNSAPADSESTTSYFMISTSPLNTSGNLGKKMEKIIKLRKRQDLINDTLKITFRTTYNTYIIE